MEETLSWQLARFASNLRFEDLPPAVVERTKLSILDALANAVSGWDTESVNIALSFVRPLARESSRATVWRDGFHAHPMDCVVANTVMVHSLLKDDSLPGSRTHPASMVVPTALSLAEDLKRTGADVIVAVVLGYELIGRLSARYKVSTPVVDRGHRGSPIFGPFGAAATAASLLKLDDEAYKNALSFAAQCCSGVLEPLSKGTPEYRFQNAAASRNGLMAALLAKEGLRAVDTIFEGDYGFLRTFAGLNEAPPEILANLGTEYEISRSTHKPYPTCGNNELAIQITERLVELNALTPQQVEVVCVRVHPQRATYPGCEYSGPFLTTEQALLSKPFALASIISTGALRVVTYRNLDDPTIARLAGQVEVVGEVGMSLQDCVVEIRLKDGSVLSGDASLVGQAAHCFDREAAVGDFKAMTASAISGERQQTVIQRVLHLDELEDVTQLTTLLVKD